MGLFLFSFFQRAFIALFLLAITGCASKKCREWDMQVNLTRCPQFNGCRMILDPDGDHSHLEVEIVRTRSGLRFYINILFLQALPLAQNPGYTQAEIMFEGGEESFIIYPQILEGGQRLLVAPEVAENLIQTLIQGQSFTIKLGRLQTQVITTNFEEMYQKFMKVPIGSVS